MKNSRRVRVLGTGGIASKPALTPVVFSKSTPGWFPVTVCETCHCDTNPTTTAIKAMAATARACCPKEDEPDDRGNRGQQPREPIQHREMPPPTSDTPHHQPHNSHDHHEPE